MKLLLFAGAGTSIELGVPGMVGLAEAFLDHSRQWAVEPETVERILEKKLDVEILIEELDRICSARTGLELIDQDASVLARLETVRAEVEWFVQHYAERVVAHDALLMWGTALRGLDAIEATVVTTNYDRGIELAANAEGVQLDDGFGTFDENKVASWMGFGSSSGRTPLIKLHGSTDWYTKTGTLTPLKLRHPMPLFGRTRLRLADGTELDSALILPSREKLLTRDPYPRLSQSFLNAADTCDAAVFVGSSLRDHHISGAAREIAGRVPLFVANPTGDTYGVAGALPIQQCASTFLVSTLPNALAGDDPLASLMASANEVNQEPVEGILEHLGRALDGDLAPNLRCEALEALDAREVTLGPDLLAQLVDDPIPQVARYSLGLVSLSTKAGNLVERASRSQHSDDAAFAEDLELLRGTLIRTSDTE